jgi:hypothetical protein
MRCFDVFEKPIDRGPFGTETNAMDRKHIRTHHVEGYLDFEKRKGAYAPVLSFMETVEVRAGVRVLEVGCAAGAFPPLSQAKPIRDRKHCWFGS